MGSIIRKGTMNEILLKIDRLAVSFETDEGIFKAVDDVSFHVKKNEIVGLIGESGCGKSVTALSILRLIPSPSGRIENGQIIFRGNDLLKLDIRKMKKIRGNAISIIFQEPSAALSPLHKIGQQIIESLTLHKNISKKTAWNIAESWLEKVGIPDAKERMFSYPYQLSGGMQQRVMIAMALMLTPDLVIADEPTTALDVTTQVQIFELIKELKQSRTSILLITHDIGIIWEMCDRVVVMYASKIVEEGNVNDIFSKSAHPYTKGLLNSVPKLSTEAGRLIPIYGYVPSPFNYPSGCYFHNRCPQAFDRCKKEKPQLVDLGNGHKIACFLV